MTALELGATDDYGLSLAKLGCKPKFRMNLSEDTTKIVRHIIEEVDQAIGTEG